jgi:hypothetical protein
MQVRLLAVGVFLASAMTLPLVTASPAAGLEAPSLGLEPVKATYSYVPVDEATGTSLFALPLSESSSASGLPIPADAISSLSVVDPDVQTGAVVGGAALPFPLPPPLSGIGVLDAGGNLYCERTSSGATCATAAGQPFDAKRYTIRWCNVPCGGWGTTTGQITMHLGDAGFTNQFTAWCLRVSDGVYTGVQCASQWRPSEQTMDGVLSSSSCCYSGWYAVEASPA